MIVSKMMLVVLGYLLNLLPERGAGIGNYFSIDQAVGAVQKPAWRPLPAQIIVIQLVHSWHLLVKSYCMCRINKMLDK